MMRRVADLLGQKIPRFGRHIPLHRRTRVASARRLARHRRDFTILDRDDAKDLIKTCIAAAGIETKGTHFPKPEVLCEIFSLAVNTHKTTDEILDEQYDYFAHSPRKSPTCRNVTPPANALPTRWTSTTCWRSGSSCFKTMPTCEIISAPLSVHPLTNIRTPTSSRATD